MTYMLDTDLIISHLNGKLNFLLTPPSAPAMSVITYAEVLYGIEKSSHLEDKSHFETFIKAMQITILPINEPIIDLYVEHKLKLERKGIKLQDFDLLIAATAIQHHLTLATANKKHFQRIKGLSLA